MRAGMDRCGIFRGITAGKVERVSVCKPEKDIHARMPVVGSRLKYHLISPAPPGRGPLHTPGKAKHPSQTHLQLSADGLVGACLFVKLFWHREHEKKSAETEIHRNY